LNQLLQKLYPDEISRPKIIGPDPHSLTTSLNLKIITYLRDFTQRIVTLGVPLFAITHHEYIEVNDDTSRGNWSSIDPNFLDKTATYASAVHNAVRSVPGSDKIQIWAGEIGPHNGGSPPCTPEYTRWANFADSFWYLDSMSLKLTFGYDGFCRQNFIGIDYGLVTCFSPFSPLPDYYAGILFADVFARGSNGFFAVNSTDKKSPRICSTTKYKLHIFDSKFKFRCFSN